MRETKREKAEQSFPCDVIRAILSIRDTAIQTNKLEEVFYVMSVDMTKANKVSKFT